MAVLTTSTVRTIDMPRDQQVSFDAVRGCIQVAHGSAWLTEAGSLQDIFLVAGEQWPLARRPVVISALAPARVRVVGAAVPDAFVLTRWWQRLVRAAHREVRRLQFGPVGMQPWA